MDIFAASGTFAIKAPVSFATSGKRKQTDADSGIEVDVIPRRVGVGVGVGRGGISGVGGGGVGVDPNVVTSPKPRPLTLAEFFSRDPTLCDEFDEQCETLLLKMWSKRS